MLPATTRYYKQQKRGNITYPARTVAMDAMLAFLGFWTADGCVRSGKIYPEVSIKQNVANEDLVRTLYYGIGYHADAERKDRELRKYAEAGTVRANYNVYDPQLNNYLAQFGKAKNKCIPRKMLNLTKSQVNILYRAYKQGDSSYDTSSDNIVLSTTSSQLMQDIQEMHLKTQGEIMQMRSADHCRYGLDYCHYGHYYANPSRHIAHDILPDPVATNYTGKIVQIYADGKLLITRNTSDVPVKSGKRKGTYKPRTRVCLLPSLSGAREIA